MLVERWCSEEATRREGGDAESFGQFVVNHLLFKFGTRPLAQARLSSMIAAVGSRFEVDRLPYFFSRFCGLTVL